MDRVQMVRQETQGLSHLDTIICELFWVINNPALESCLCNTSAAVSWLLVSGFFSFPRKRFSMNLFLLLLLTRLEAALPLICDVQWAGGQDTKATRAVLLLTNDTMSPLPCTPVPAQSRRVRHQLPRDTLSTSQQPSSFILTRTECA